MNEPMRRLVGVSTVAWPLALLLSAVAFILGIWFDGRWALTACVLVGVAIVAGIIHIANYEDIEAKQVEGA